MYHVDPSRPIGDTQLPTICTLNAKTKGTCSFDLRSEAVIYIATTIPASVSPNSKS